MTASVGVSKETVICLPCHVQNVIISDEPKLNQAFAHAMGYPSDVLFTTKDEGANED